MRKVVFVLLTALWACATPYQEAGFLGGVRAMPLGGDVYRVEGHLNAYSSQSLLQDYMLLRAAETAQAQGAVGFVILGEQSDSQRGAIVTPGYANTTANVTAYGNTAYGSAQTTYTPAQAYGYIKPGGIMMISLVRQGQANGPYFDAAQIIAAIGPRVRR